MKKQILCPLMAVILCIFIMAGCVKKPEENEIESANEEYTHLSLFCDVDFWNPPSWETKEGTITGDISEKTGVVVDVDVPVRDADKQLSLMLINDELPDIISVTDSTVIHQLVTSGKVWTIDKFFEKYKPDSHILKKFPEDIKKELIKRDGGWYAYPSHMASEDARKIWPESSECYREFVNYGDNLAIMWNRKLLGELGVDAAGLKNESDVLEVFEQAKNAKIFVNDKPVIPLLLDGQDYQEFSLRFLKNSFGAEYVNEDGIYMDSLLQPESKEALRFLNTAMRNEYSTADQLVITNDKVKQYIAGGRVLCFIGNTANTNMLGEEWVSSGPIFSDSGKKPIRGNEMRAGKGWLSTFISKKCSEPEKLAEWFDYMTSNEGKMLWDFGREGIHYNMTEDGLVEQTKDGLWAAANYGKTGVKAWWMFVNSAWEWENLAPVTNGSREEAVMMIQTAYGKNEEVQVYDSSLLEMSAEFLAENSDFADLETRVNECKKKEIVKVIMAESDTEFEKAYQSMIDALEQAGIHELDRQKNVQYQLNCQETGRRIEKIN